MSTGARVDYHQPGHAERYVLIFEYTTVVGPAMMQSAHHRANFSSAVTTQCSTDATHNFVFRNLNRTFRARFDAIAAVICGDVDQPTRTQTLFDLLGRSQVLVIISKSVVRIQQRPFGQYLLS